MLRIISFIIFCIALLSACQSTKNHIPYFNNCPEKGFQFSEGSVVKDSTGSFGIWVPEGFFSPMRIVEGNASSLIVGGDLPQGRMVISVRKEFFEGAWNWEEEEKSLGQDMQVLESDDMHWNGLPGKYHLVQFPDAPELVSLFMSLVDEQSQIFYTIDITTENNAESKQVFCLSRSLLDGLILQ